MCISTGYSQKKSNDLERVNTNQFDISSSTTDLTNTANISNNVSTFERIGRSATIGAGASIGATAGISSPSSGFSDNSFASNGNFIELTGAYYFSKLGIGLSLGQFTNPTDSNFSDVTSTREFTTLDATEDWKIMYYGVGPEYEASFGNFNANFSTKIGFLSVKAIEINSSYNGSDVQTPIPVYKLTTDKTSSLSYFSAGLKFGYNINSNLNVFATTNYLSGLSDGITISEGTNLNSVRDINKNGVIDAEDFIGADGTALQFETTSTDIKPQTANYGIGITWNMNPRSKVRKPMQDVKNIGQDQKTRMNKGELVDHIATGDGISKNNTSKVVVRGWNPKDKSRNINVQFENPAKEKADKENKQRKLVNVTPKNNSRFKIEDNLKNFSWKVVGERIMRPQYSIEISKIKSDGSTNQWMLVAKSGKPTLSLTELFNQNSANERVSERLRHKDRAVFTDGKYKWKVTETSTGISSNPTYFTFSNCEIDFSISNEEIECLGYEGANRKFKICFDSTYSSTSGDLTFVNPGTGLTVFDQTYAALTYTLVPPNPTLVPQIGATVSTISYCFEVTVPSSVTSIGFGLQGDDLDPSPILCQPGVSQLFDDLPDCICDECEDIELSFDDFNISLNGASGNQFNFNGNINVNVPVYGIEFQIQSYSYTANPSACTEGVSSVEESGMILMPGTTINGSSTLQLFNETASGSASSNDNATKDIKYTSNSPISGAIPVNLTIGLPGPISGLDPSCCVIDYTVCIKVKIFYDEGNCKSCVFTHCFQFNNQ